MSKPLLRATAVAVFGALSSALAVAAFFAARPELVLEMDRPIPRAIESGWYEPERDGEYTFAWTSPQATLSLRGLARDVSWECTVRFRGGRGGDVPQPQVDLSIDGLIAASATATNEQQELTAVAPRRASARGLELTIAASPPVVPGGSDTRALGVQIDRLRCRPGDGEIPLVPRGTMVRAAMAGAWLGLALGLSGVTLASALLGAIAIAAAQALPLSSGPAPYTRFAETAVGLAGWIALGIVGIILTIERWRRTALRNTARFAILFSGVSLYLQLLGLLHPSKLVIDAVFHAHRLEWVLGGRYFFTQPMPGGVSFPYAIGVYVFAAPWTMLTHDYVTLLRVVVTTMQVIAGALLYPVLARAWGDRLAAAIAVGLFSLVPLPYELLGNANLANVFAQAVATMAVLGAIAWPLQRRQFGQVAGLFVITALAFLSHVSTFAQLTVTLFALIGFYLWRGGPALRAPARWIAIVTVLAALFAVALYYGRFTEVYVKALRVRAAASVPAGPSVTDPSASSASQNVASRPLTSRLGGALRLTTTAIGWPMLILAFAGAGVLWHSGARDRATLAILAWGAAYLVFLGVGLMRVEGPFQRYAAEFVGRVVLATSPAVVMLAARGASRGLKGGLATRACTSAALVAAIAVGASHWERWFT